MRDLLLRPLGPSIAATFALGGGLWPTEIDQARLETSPRTWSSMRATPCPTAAS
jgi:hypothetical protein